MGCSTRRHREIQASRAAFEAGTRNRREWPGEAFEIGECLGCDSSIAFPPDEDDAVAEWDEVPTAAEATPTIRELLAARGAELGLEGAA